MNQFSKRLKETRISKHITQKTMAEFLNIYLNAYQMYEYNKREPNFDTLIKICQYLNTTSDYLLGLSNNPNIEDNPND